METQISMPDLLQFYSELAVNNEKKWFDERKPHYLAIKSYYENLGMEIADGIARYDKDIAGLGPKDITWRIYQDQRFYGRPPYKTWCGLFFAKGGRKSHYAGYYLHIEPGQNEYFLCAGLWREEKLIIKSVREEIMLNGPQFDKVANPGKGWQLLWDGALTRPAQGWPDDKPYSKYFRLKQFLIMKPIDTDYLLRPDLAARVASDFKTAAPFNQYLNRPVDYAIEEWM